MLRPLRAASGKVPCRLCNMRRQRPSADLDGTYLHLFDKRLVLGLRSLARGAHLFRAGNAFDAEFPVRTRVSKSVVASNQWL